MNNLSVETFPLQGHTLIEASAGTGKTHTITALYNRLIVGHGRERLGCDEILVVTFTRAATEELRGRIRQRVRDSFFDLLRLNNDQVPLDANIAQYITEIAKTQNSTESAIREALTPWLQANLALMDEASIFTIHGFCQRVLKQFAFDSGVMFSADLVLDSDAYLKQACEDVWRQYVYAMTDAQSSYLLSYYAGPEHLMAHVRSRINRPDIRVLPDIEQDDFSTLWALAQDTFEQVQNALQQTSASELGALIAQSGLNKKSYSSKNAPNWISKTYAYFHSVFSLPYDETIERLGQSAMLEKLDISKGPMPDGKIFQLIDDYCTLAKRIQIHLERGWQKEITDRYFTLLEQSGALTPNDLLRLLKAALYSAQGDSLAHQIRRLYPVAMIDEFQDTDPQQYAIFQRIYAADNADNALIMIGDPKQAIYAFRGADIFTYIRARRDLTENQRFTLDTNWRSHSLLVDGVNTLFSQNVSPFVYDQDIPFYPVKASAKHDKNAFKSKGVDQPALQLMCDQVQYSRATAQALAASQCAQKIAALLTNKDMTLGNDCIAANDIAVLVRSHYQAQKIRNALQSYGIGSVFLSRESVFKSQEAIDLFSWLNAVISPANERLLRSALVTSTQQYNSVQLNELLHSETLWEGELQRYFDYQALWHKRGIMAAMMSWLEHDDLAVRLRQDSEGERRLTNLMHLGELLQSASRQLRGQEALLRWFGERVFTDHNETDDAQLRLESDANLVNIVTIHKSKGLQYPLVFLPYLWDDESTLRSGADIVFFDEKTEQTILHLNPDSDMRTEAERAVLAENLRLLYVALTRAEQGCFVWILDTLKQKNSKNPTSRLPKTALGYLLQLGENPDWNALRTRLGSNILLGMPQWAHHHVDGSNFVDASSLKPAVFKDRQRDYWRVGSYSQLIAAQGEYALHDVLRTDEANLESYGVAVSMDMANVEFDAQNPALTFAKGPDAGTCLHAIFERWNFQTEETLNVIVHEELQHYGLLTTDAKQVQEVCDWLCAVVHTPLFDDISTVNNTSGFCLADIDLAQRLDEMEFYLPVHALHPKQVDDLLSSNNRFSFDRMEGYLKGFIDLIFCHNGRYYVADYKSNYLGSSVSDYLPDALQQAMYEHAYDLQAWIYTLALDKLLTNRLPNYSPATHLGGVYYFFIRGMHLGAQSPIIEKDTPPLKSTVGVYYHAVDTTVLHQWQRVFAGKTAGDAA